MRFNTHAYLVRQESNHLIFNLFLFSCSLPCSKTHKATPCEPPEPKRNPIPIHNVSSASKEEEEDEDAILLTSEQLNDIAGHKEVQRKTRDDYLMEIVARIDSAPNRAAALEKEMKGNPAFLEFCDDILEAVGCKDPAAEEINLEELVKQQLDNS